MKHLIWLMTLAAVACCDFSARADAPAQPAPAVVSGCGGCAPCCGDKVLFQCKSLRRYPCGTLCCNPCPQPCPQPCPKVCCPQDCGPRCKFSLFADRPRCQKNPPCCEPCPAPCPAPCAKPCEPSCGHKFSLGGLFHKKNNCDPCCGSGAVYVKPTEKIEKMPDPKPKGGETLLPAPIQ